MGEIVASTGCRPIVVRLLPNGPYTDKRPGFNPYRISEDDREIDEQDGKNKIFKRLNPNLPPRDLACIHQIEEKSAVCPVNCLERCEPDGYNVLVTWDKTSNKTGPSYLHIPKPLKDLMDAYSLKRNRFFERRKLSKRNEDNWWEDDKAFFF